MVYENISERNYKFKKGGNMRRSILLVLILLSVLFSPQISTAHKFMLGGGAGFVMKNTNAEGGISYGGCLTYQMDNMFGFKTSVGRYSSQTIVKRLQQGGYSRLSDGDYSLLWIEESIIIRKERQGVQPYIGGGAGYYITEHGLSSEAKTWLAGYHYELVEDIDDIFSMHLRIGLNIAASPQVSVSVDYKYAFVNPVLKATLTDLITSEKYYINEEIDLGVKGFSVDLSLVF